MMDRETSAQALMSYMENGGGAELFVELIRHARKHPDGVALMCLIASTTIARELPGMSADRFVAAAGALYAASRPHPAMEMLKAYVAHEDRHDRHSRS